MPGFSQCMLIHFPEGMFNIFCRCQINFHHYCMLPFKHVSTMPVHLQLPPVRLLSLCGNLAQPVRGVSGDQKAERYGSLFYLHLSPAAGPGTTLSVYLSCLAWLKLYALAALSWPRYDDSRRDSMSYVCPLRLPVCSLCVCLYRSKVEIRCSPLLFSTLFFETRITHWMQSSGYWLASLHDLSVSACPVTVACSHVWLYTGARNPNSSPHFCIATPLSTKLSPSLFLQF